MANRNKHTRSTEIHMGFQIAPMIDVVFVIMLFFMVMAGQVQKEQELKLKLPGRAVASEEVEAIEETQIRVLESGDVLLNDEPMGAPGDAKLVEMTATLIRLKQASDEDEKHEDDCDHQALSAQAVPDGRGVEVDVRHGLEHVPLRLPHEGRLQAVEHGEAKRHEEHDDDDSRDDELGQPERDLTVWQDELAERREQEEPCEPPHQTEQHAADEALKEHPRGQAARQVEEQQRMQHVQARGAAREAIGDQAEHRSDHSALRPRSGRAQPQDDEHHEVRRPSVQPPGLSNEEVHAQAHQSR